MFFLVQLFVTFLYQPFLNLLVGVYWIMEQIPGVKPDMGVAVIIFTIVFRILWTPISLASGRTYNERKAIAKKVAELEEKYSDDPIKQRAAIKQVFRGNARIVWSSFATIFLQVLIALMLWRIFAKGLEGEDLHFLYSWMPHQSGEYNLIFLGKYDLTHPNMFLNFIQALVIFLVEALQALFSQESKYRREVIMAQFVLPLVSFIIFAMMPAGKKLFIITTLIYSIGLILFRQISYWISGLGKKVEKIEAKAIERKQAEENEDDSNSDENKTDKKEEKDSNS